MSEIEGQLERLTTALADRYRIEGELGQGGMATVYLADDLRHERKVAVKVLRPDLAAVVGAERFLAEIKTTAGLQHPHILPLFDSGDADGLLFYVMPYVEGESLRDRLDREHQLPVDEAVQIATNVAEALDYAHAHGVVHRDIKPENILLQSGKPVVADFGIALAVSAGGGSRLTETGLSLGTPHYMSLEQATGDAHVGPATDLYALGCVLYEMLVGDPPYTGSTPQMILGRIISGGPASATEMRSSVPANVDAAIRKGLEKLPADRFTGAHDFAQALANEGFRHGEFAEAGKAAEKGRWSPLTTGLAVTAGVFATITLLLGMSVLSSEEPAPVGRYSLAIPEGWAPTSSFSVAPDGSAIVYRAVVDGTEQVYVRRLDNLVPTPVPGSGEGVWPTMSPTGSEVAFVTAGQLRVARVSGGTVRTLTSEVECCSTWGADGFIYFTAPGGDIARVRPEGGPVEPVTEIDREQSGSLIRHAFMRVRSAGDVAVYTAHGIPSRIEALRLDDGQRRTLTEGVDAYPLPPGALTYVTGDGRLMVAPFDAEALELTGDAVQIADGLAVGRDGETTLFGVGRSGTMAYRTLVQVEELVELVWMTRSGEIAPVDPGWVFDPSSRQAQRAWSLSPDGTRIAVRIVTDLGSDIWIKQLPAGPLSRLTFHEATDAYPRWTPDGESVTFLSQRGGVNALWVRRADGTGDAQRVEYPPLDGDLAAGNWAPGNDWMLAVVRRRGSVTGMGWEIWGVRPGVDSVATPLVVSEFGATSPAVSPDGRWLAYHSNETGRREVFVRPFPDTGGRQVQVSVNGGRAPVWAHNGTELFYVTDGGGTSGARELMVAEIRPGPMFTVVDRRVLLSIPQGIYFANNTTSYGITPDDQRFLMARVVASGAQTGNELILVTNAFEEIKQLLGN